jgi:hypothetical protein
MIKFITIAILIIAGAWFANEQDFFVSSEKIITDSALLQAGDKCANIATNAVAKLPIIVEFQRLEVAGRKARVMRQCMEDNGYVENTLWVEANTTASLKVMKETNVSEYEALENMKRIAMYDFSATNRTPSYWMKVKPAVKPSTQ